MDEEGPEVPDNRNLVHGNFHLLIPANKYDLNLCKTVLSALVLGYPAPTLVNWGREFHDSRKLANGSHEAKLDGIAQYLTVLDKTHDDDLILIVDGFDTWFQLGPKVLINRFLTVNREADERNKKHFFGDSGMTVQAQEAVFSVQKTCWPGDEAHDIRCYGVPRSPLPAKVFLDQDMNEDCSGWTGIHGTTIDNMCWPRFLNSGMVMGRVANLRAIYQRAAGRSLKSHSHLGSDQAILADILGEQGYWREITDHRRLPLISRIRSLLGLPRRWWRRSRTILDPHLTRKRPSFSPARQYDLGLGLDYASSLAQNTIFSENDSTWVRFDDPARILHMAHNLTINLPKAWPMAKDIGDQPHPSSMLFDDASTTTTTLTTAAAGATGPSWESMPFYTNLWTGITPVVIHHNAWQHDLKKVRDLWWNRMWYFPFARRLLQKRLMMMEQQQQQQHQKSNERTLIAVDKNGKHWWSHTQVAASSSSKGGIIAQPETTWEGLCSAELQESIFQDGLGPVNTTSILLNLT